MTGPLVRVDPAAPVPPYEQVRQQIADLIDAAVLPAGQRLPPVRQLAADLGLAPGTVARAYQELEAAGLVRTRRGGGTRVAEGTRRRPGSAQAVLAAKAAEFVAAARELDVDDAAVLGAVRAALLRPVG